MIAFRPTPRQRHILDALALLARFEPWAYARIMNEVRTILFAPSLCQPDAIACAGGPLGRVIALAHDPLGMDVVELAALIVHEALHIATDRYGRLVAVPHECEDCRSLKQRARDAIYQAEADVERRLRAATGIRRRQPSRWAEAVGAVAMGAMLGLAVVGIAAAFRSGRT